MYIKVQTRLKADASGKMHYAYYPRLYESYRNSDGRVRQHYLLPLNLDDLPSHKDRNTMCRVLNDMVGSGLAIQFEVVKSEQAHPLGDGKNPFTGGQK